MNFKNNPFFVLKLPCSAGKREVVSAAEELSFFIDPDLCTEAQNDLINPAKRLKAELSWFIELNGKELQAVFQKIEKGEPLQASGFCPLTRLNATLYNFSVSGIQDKEKLDFAISDIDRQYTELDIKQIADNLNKCRAEAGITPAPESDISNEIGNLHNDIKQIISEKLFLLEQDEYIDLVTLITEKYIANKQYNDGVVLSDLLDQYELKMQVQIEDYTSKIYSRVKLLSQQQNRIDIEDGIAELTAELKVWDRLVQPLQLKSAANGMPHTISEDLGVHLHEFVMLLVKQKHLPHAALDLLDTMQDTFAELDSIYEVAKVNSDVLRSSLFKGSTEPNKYSEHMSVIFKTAKLLEFCANDLTVNSFIRRVKRLNAQFKNEISDIETQTDCRKNLLFEARSVAIVLCDSVNRIRYAVDIFNMLSSEFADIKGVDTLLKKDRYWLNQRLIALSRENSEDNHKIIPKNFLNIPTWLLIVIIIAVLIAFIGLFSMVSFHPLKGRSREDYHNDYYDDYYYDDYYANSPEDYYE